LDNLEQHIEALIFASELSLGTAEIQMILEQTFQAEVNPEDIRAAIERIREKYDDEAFAIGLEEINGGYQFLTKKTYHKVIQSLQIFKARKRLSQAAIETLAIIAYRQPITKLEIEQIRGVNCDYTIQKLLEKELISIAGKSSAIGKPLLYSTSPLFMDYFGINTAADLPQLKDLAAETNDIGAPASE
jgi:segregation and condensation protein B